MRSSRTDTFKKLFEKLPIEIQEKAAAIYRQWRVNPYHPSLHFKCVHFETGMWSIRITKKYRAICLKEDKDHWWHWIGSHNDYDNLV